MTGGWCIVAKLLEYLGLGVGTRHKKPDGLDWWTMGSVLAALVLARILPAALGAPRWTTWIAFPAAVVALSLAGASFAAARERRRSASGPHQPGQEARERHGGARDGDAAPADRAVQGAGERRPERAADEHGR